MKLFLLDVLLIDTSDGSTNPLKHHEMGTLSAAWSNNGSYVASGGQDGYVHIYNSEGIHTGTIEMTEWINALASVSYTHLTLPTSDLV